MEILSSFWARPSAGFRFRAYCVAYTVGSWVHLTLPDAIEDPRWWPANTAYLAGTLVVLFRGALLGWCLCAAGLVTPILFYEDQLTQSAFLLACSLASAAFWIGAEGREERMGESLPNAVGGMTVATYALASFHKLNSGFFHSETGCGASGLRLLASNWSFEFPAELLAWAAPCFLAAEICLAVLFLVRPAWALPLAFVLHIPLTIVFAPSFAFVMMIGWVCLLGEVQLRALGRIVWSYWAPIAIGGILLGGGSLALYLREHWVLYPWWSVREALLWSGLVASLIAVRKLPGRPRRRSPKAGLVVATVTAYAVHGLSPYSGIQFHHTGAMLSNLRIDRGCWNHLIVPESVRQVEPYIRIESASVQAAGAATLEARLVDTLWNRRSLARAATRWCAQGATRLGVRARYRREALDIPNLCVAPFPFGKPWFTGMRLHQENTHRSCQRACIH